MYTRWDLIVCFGSFYPSKGEIYAQLDVYVRFAFKQGYVALFMWPLNALLTHGIYLAEVRIKFSALGFRSF